MSHLTTDLIKLNNLQLAGKLVSEELWLGIHGSRRSVSYTHLDVYKRQMLSLPLMSAMVPGEQRLPV